jgi:predicted signal transduction protein with EAL and GGDEF domain
MDIPGHGPITASFGIASFPVHASSRDTIVVAADRALYKSKHSGRNCISLPSEDDTPDVERPDQSNPRERQGALSVR